jgi:hypothetical protein
MVTLEGIRIKNPDKKQSTSRKQGEPLALSASKVFFLSLSSI